MEYTKREMNFSGSAFLRPLMPNKNLEKLETIIKVINWDKIGELLSKNIKLHRIKDNADIYTPVLLLKCLLLKKWFCIYSDSELVNEINDRISFKKFIGLPFGISAPNPSLISGFKDRLPKKGMIPIYKKIFLAMKRNGIKMDKIVGKNNRPNESASITIHNIGQSKSVKGGNNTDQHDWQAIRDAWLNEYESPLHELIKYTKFINNISRLSKE